MTKNVSENFQGYKCGSDKNQLCAKLRRVSISIVLVFQTFRRTVVLEYVFGDT